MWNSRWKYSLGLVALWGTASFSPSAVGQESKEPETKEIIIRSATEAKQNAYVPVQVGNDAVFALVAEGGEEVSPYWIGVQLEPPTDILRAHLNLEGGMIAAHVYDDTPAAKAGIKVNDIILKAGEKYVKEPGDLVKAVADAKETELTLIVLHGGKETAIKVTPVKRAQEPNPQAVKEAASQEKEAVQRLEAALNAYRRRAAEGANPLELMQIKPGIVTTRHVYRAAELPKDVTVRITKEGSSPAKIYVKRDGKEWEVTEDKLGELPEDVRGYVQQFRTRTPITMAIKLPEQAAPYGTTARLSPQPVLPLPAAPGTQAVPTAPYAAVPGTAMMGKTYQYRVTQAKIPDGMAVEQKLDQILKLLGHKEDSSLESLKKEVNQLRKELDELRKEKK